MGRHLDALLDLLYPPRCAACDAFLAEAEDAEAAAFCPLCRAALEPVPEAACPRCAEPGSGPPVPSSAGASCLACRTRPPAFARAHAAYLYGGPLLEAVHALKFGRREDLCRPLGRMMAERLAACPPEVDVVVPVPLHPARLRRRGFDQAAGLAREVGRRLGLPVRPDLRRVRATDPQAVQDRPARARNVLGAFAARGPAGGRRVLLVDDVLTTGATAAAAASALLAAGAVRVEVAVLARAE